MQADGQQENSQRFRARNDSSRDPQRKQIAQRRTVPQRKRLLEVKPGVFLIGQVRMVMMVMMMRMIVNVIVVMIVMPIVRV